MKLGRENPRPMRPGDFANGEKGNAVTPPSARAASEGLAQAPEGVAVPGLLLHKAVGDLRFAAGAQRGVPGDDAAARGRQHIARGAGAVILEMYHTHAAGPAAQGGLRRKARAVSVVQVQAQRAAVPALHQNIHRAHAVRRRKILRPRVEAELEPFGRKALLEPSSCRTNSASPAGPAYSGGMRLTHTHSPPLRRLSR